MSPDRGARRGGSTDRRTQPPANPDIDELLSRLSLEATIGQLVLQHTGSLETEDVVHLFADHHVGGLVFGGGEPPTFDPEALVEGVNDLREQSVERSEHGIPFVLGVDALHGNAIVDGATVYPHNSALGATRSADLCERIGTATGRSIEAVGVDWNFSPTTDVLRDPRWGRFYEGFCEDPYVSGDLAAARVRGNEGDGETTWTAACVKHFAAYSAANNGNDRSPADVSMRELRTQVLPAYERALAAEPATVMVSSGSLNGVPAHASSWLLTTVLREHWGYEGLVVSDWADFERMGTWHKYVDSYREGIERGLNAGVDVYMLPEDPGTFVSHAVDLVESGAVSRDRIEEAARRVLEFKRDLGLFQDPYVDEGLAADRVGSNRELAVEAAEKSLTLLENDGDVLPLDDVDTVVLSGPATDSVAMQMGGWTLGWQTIGNDDEIDAEPAATTIAEGVERRVDESTTLLHEPTEFTHDIWRYSDTYGFDESAVCDAASEADAVVLALGEGPYAEWFGDRDTLALPEPQRRLVETVAGTIDDATDLIGVLVAGRPRGGPETLAHFDALLMSHLPGTGGGTAVARALFGDVEPTGRLPFVWPKNVGCVPDYYNSVHEPRDIPSAPDAVFERDPLYEFGHGLGYADVECQTVDVDPTRIEDPARVERVSVEATLENASDRDGTAVAEAYVTAVGGSVMHPKRQLVATERVHLSGGEQTSVQLEVPLRRLEVVPGDVVGHRAPTVEAAEYTVTVGDCSDTFTVTDAGQVSDREPLHE